MPVRRLKFLTDRQYVFVTTTVYDWTSVFAEPSLAELVVAELIKTIAIKEAHLIAYVVMPSHVHFIAEIEDYARLSQLVETFKSVVSRKMRKLLPQEQRRLFEEGSAFRFWMRRFDDVVLVSEKQLRIKMEYIHNNPVKAKLVANAIDWPWSSAKDWLTDREETIIKKDVF